MTLHAESNRLRTILATFEPISEEESTDVERLRQLVNTSADPWTRASLLHVTSSALVVHPQTGRVLLRWHERQQAWLQVGGHADPGESDPFTIAVREAREETGLTDLVAWPEPQSPRPVQIVVVPVPAGKGEPSHEHGDIRYTLATASPDAVAPENDAAQLQWLDLDAALARVGEDNLRICLLRVAKLMRSTARTSA